ncbi:hypothetical protein C8Q75DRAFT_713369 [Abortiporus biennis]|nr:hypothetical protein C8Q75DRAFT_713369 [Abortiporus biennis]
MTNFKSNLQVAPGKFKARPKAKTTASKAKHRAVDGGVGGTGNSLSIPSSSGSKTKKSSPLVPTGAAGNKRGTSTTAGGAGSRSRSTSVMPPTGDGDKKVSEEHEEEEEEEVDDKLYCICKTSYDEDKVMIACDRCDEWYHTQCVHMPDLEVDLVDQFICPVCIKNNPNLPLKTTYKRRCFYGLKHPRPSSAEACHKPARGAFSKYCSDECGIAYMHSRIEAWGGDPDALWESVKDSSAREAVVVRCLLDSAAPPDTQNIQMNGGVHQHLHLEPNQVIIRPSKTKTQRALERLQRQLDKISGQREEIKKDLEVVFWREKLVELATLRAEGLDECGWDQRLCFGDEEYAEFGQGVLESYEEDGHQRDGDTEDAMQVDGVEGEWWCKGKKKCARHAGWQKLRQVEVESEKEGMDATLARLTARERELRKQMEEVAEQKRQAPPMVFSSTNGPLQPLNGTPTITVNGGPKVNGDHASKKGKKRKSEAS